MSTNHTDAPPPTIPYASPPITVILTIILLLFFFIGFFSIYFCRCFMQNLLYTWHIRQNPSRTPAGPEVDVIAPGLDPLIINSFPTFTYSSVKEYRRENYELECAICLCEFKDENVLRLLTKCYHVFHQECIDLWLGSHKSCPCCRCTLDTHNNSPEKSPVSVATNLHEAPENGSVGDSVRIDINEDNNENGEKDEGKKEEHVVIEVEPDRNGGFRRSKSTGHSIVRDSRGCENVNENKDRFMLKLGKDVQEKLIIPRHSWTRSCTEFGEYKSKTSSSNGGFGEVTLDRDKA